jgi:hypothetical protein
MDKFCPSEHCLFERSIKIDGLRVTIHYLPWNPEVQVSLCLGHSFVCDLLVSKFLYRSDFKTSEGYEAYLDFMLGSDEDFADSDFDGNPF